MPEYLPEYLPEAFKDAHAVHGSWIFGRVTYEPVNHCEGVYGWAGGPMAVGTGDEYKRVLAHADVLFEPGIEPRAVRMFVDPDGPGAAVIWARIEDTQDGPRIVGWPEDQAVPKGYCR